jgi:two-component system OmpR family sensor kinase
MRKQWLWVVVPLVIGISVAVGLNLSSWPNPVLYMRASLSAIILLLTLIISLALAATLWWRQQLQSRQQQAASQCRAESVEDRRRFLQRLDHELKNPLMAMRAGLANVADAPTDELRRQALGSIEAQTVRLSRLTADLRKIADLETRPLERTPIDLASLLHDVVELAQDQPAANGRQITLIVPQAPWPLPMIPGDQDLLFLTFYNLLENALKFTQPDDAIELRAREDGRFVIVEVADTGPGIAAEEQLHVWEELYRGYGAHGVPGSGLGLSLVKAVVERHNGKVNLHSRPLQGTLVTVHLPVA